MSQTTDKGGAAGDFDPVAYIENAFSDTKPTPSRTAVMEKDAASRNGHAPRATTESKRALSAPRPRRVKAKDAASESLNTETQRLWSHLPKIINFLQSNFNDSVTANYYRGEFKETRAELIERLLDPELTLEEVSRILGVCPATVRRYTNRGWLGHHRTKGGQRRFRLSGVAKFVEEHGRDIRD
ncbi:MAG: helix-turn-helix domain-containing protein [Chthonomonas sp.]|nr:helix-turn-helix domain-containing protein [Chthonomonas sp.]